MKSKVNYEPIRYTDIEIQMTNVILGQCSCKFHMVDAMGRKGYLEMESVLFGTPSELIRKTLKEVRIENAMRILPVIIGKISEDGCDFLVNRTKLTIEEPNPIPMTKEQIEYELGYKIELVKGEN